MFEREKSKAESERRESKVREVERSKEDSDRPK